MARVINKCEMSKVIELSSLHHDQAKHVCSLLCIPLDDPFKTFKKICVVEVVWQIEQLGTAQFKMSVKERLTDQTKSIWDPIKINKPPLFSRPQVKLKLTDEENVTSLKND